MKVIIARPLKVAAKLVLSSHIVAGVNIFSREFCLYVLRVTKMTLTKITFDPLIPLSGIFPEEKKLNNIHENIHDNPFVIDKNW